MKKNYQSQIFFEKEGNEYFKRNLIKNEKFLFSNDLLTKTIEKKISKKGEKYNILEIGCCTGHRLYYLKKKFTLHNYYGVDPSSDSINYIKKNFKEIKGSRGTADILKFSDQKFDIVILGFFLYLCDDEDLFKISSEVFRVLKKGGTLFIEDFIVSKPKYVKYKHRKNIFCRKMNYTLMFNWHPKLHLVNKKIYFSGSKKLKQIYRKVTVVELKKHLT